ncbi:DUF3732 domain-containing protein [Sulfuricurvum sp.]|uniref:DUF3732 domain-containing protein n=1 Tax=Sulfuricurvum sp. TaxID=2025608 RepID=UPI00286E471D|nr:DUF3732 domain-containing protein [Sulfuricurvum sp.]
MLFRINEIGLFQQGKKDIVKFNDEINFISGESNTGKSSIGAIINYCLGSSKNIPGAKIANEPDIFSINVTIDTHNILIARNKFNATKLKGEKYIFLKKVEYNFSLYDIDMSFFNDNQSEYFTKDDFIELEIPKYFSSFPPKTRLNGKEMVRPTVRNMPPFMLQVQDTIKNQSHLFYQMSGIKSKGIKRDFELFLGLVDFNIYNKINRKNEIIKELKKIENSKSLYEDELKKEYFNLKSSYHRLFTHLNQNIDVETLDKEYLLNQENLNNLKLEYNIDSDIGKNIEKLENKTNQQSRLVENLKIEYSNIKNQIQHIDTANLKLQVKQDIHYSKHCPTCNSEIEKEIEVFEIAKQKILSEKTFLHNVNRDILEEKKQDIKEKLDTEKVSLDALNKELNELKHDSKEAITIRKKEQLLYEIKGMIKKNIQTIIEYEEKSSNDSQIEALQQELEILEKELIKIDIKKKKQEAELYIGNYSTEMLKTLPFDRDFGEPNLKFDIKDVTAYQQTTNNIFYLSDIGSAENHLSFHLSVFLGLHKYILEHNQSILPSLIFLDQPSQVYFPKEEDFKNGTGDIKKVEDMYKSIIKFIEDANKTSMFSKIQIIIVDHFYSGEEWYQKYLVEPRWEKDKKLGLIKG